jgi:hypothetical protein
MPKQWVLFSVSNLVSYSIHTGELGYGTKELAWLWAQGFRSGRLRVGSSVMSPIDKGVTIIYAHVIVPLPRKIEKKRRMNNGEDTVGKVDVERFEPSGVSKVEVDRAARGAIR